MRLSDLFIDYSTHTAGLDLSGTGIRFVQMRLHGATMEVVSYGSFPKTDGAFYRTDVLNADRAAANIRDGLPFIARNVRAAYTSIPEQHSFLKLLTVPSTAGSNLDESIRWETTQHIPYELKELAIDWMKVPTNDPNRYAALVAACPTHLSDSYRSVIERAGLQAFGLEPVSVSLARAFQHLFVEGTTGMLVYLGEYESVAIVFNDGIPYLTASLPFTTDSLVTAIMKRFNVSYGDAQKSLFSFGFYKLRARGLVRNLLVEPLELLVKRLQSVDDFAQNHFNSVHPIGSVHICGAGAPVAGLIDELTNRMKLPVRTATAPNGLRYGHRAKDFPRVFQEYSIAFGLALNATTARSI